MSETTKTGYYAVHIGRQPGVYPSWKKCEEQVKGFPKASYKKFNSALEADVFFKYGPNKQPSRSDPHRSSMLESTTEVSIATVSSELSAKKRYVDKKLPKRKKDIEIINENDWDVVYTDGACQNNGQQGAVAGIGVWNISERCPGDQTNNRAELIAIIRLLEKHLITNKPLLIKTDSSYSISCIRDWLPNWKKRGWKTATNTDVKNKEVIVYLSNLLDERARQGQVVRLQHVRGHQGIVGNEGADTLAREGCLLPSFEREFVVCEEQVSKESIDLDEFQEDDLLSPEELRKMEETGMF